MLSVIAITNNNVGIDHVTLISHIINASTFTSKITCNTSHKNPITKEINTATKPIKNEIRAPTNNLT